MPFKLDIEKAIQASGVLLRREHARRMNSMRLLKVLYFASRESIGATGHPIVPDRYVAMERGPVLSGVYDLIKGMHPDIAKWSRYFRTDHYDTEMVEEPGVGRLSKSEIDTLHLIADRYESKDEWAMVQEGHQLPEWIKNECGESSVPIPLIDILEALGRGDDVERIEKENASYTRAGAFFSRRSA